MCSTSRLVGEQKRARLEKASRNENRAPIHRKKENQQFTAMSNDSVSISSGLPAGLDPSQGIENPLDLDILCGRGKSIAHKGNALFRELIDAKKDEYQAARRREDKTRLTCEIVAELRQSSRFLLKDPKLQLWFEVGEEYIKEKVSHALRSRPNEERKRRLKPKKKIVRKQTQSLAVEEAAESIIREQQLLLKSMIEREGGGGGISFE